MARRRSPVAALLLIAACGGGGAGVTITTDAVTTSAPSVTTTTEPGLTVISEDGGLRVTVPHSAAASDPGITIQLLGAAEYPPGLEGLPAEAGLQVYDLGPDGFEFGAPVTITVRRDVAAFEGLAPNEVPVMVLLTSNSDGGFELLGDLAITRRGSEVLVSGTTAHFSPVVAVQESTTAVVTLDREMIEAVPSMRSFQNILQLGAEVPGLIPVAPAGFRDSSGSIAGGIASPVSIDGLPFSGRGSSIDIKCEDVAQIDVMPITFSAEFGTSSGSGALAFTRLDSLLLDPAVEELRLTLAARARCWDPTTSILHRDLSGLEVATDHPGGTVWIPNEDFLGGLSATLGWLPLQPDVIGLYAGLICDNDGNGVVDATDTMFPAYPLSEVSGRLEFKVPLFGFADYFVYMLDGKQYSGMPSGTGWPVGEAFSAFESMYTGLGRFESSLGVAAVDGMPFVYPVGPSEASVPAGAARLEMFEMLRVRF